MAKVYVTVDITVRLTQALEIDPDYDFGEHLEGYSDFERMQEFGTMPEFNCVVGERTVKDIDDKTVYTAEVTRLDIENTNILEVKSEGYEFSDRN